MATFCTYWPKTTDGVPSALAASVMALDRLLSHGMLTLITIFCCARQPHDAETRGATQISFRALKIKLKQRFLNSSKELSGPCLPSLPAGSDLSETDENISKNCRDRSLNQSRRIGWLVIAN